MGDPFIVEPDGVDSGPGIQAALDRFAVVQLRPGQYQCNQGLRFTRNGQQLIGAQPIYAYEAQQVFGTSIQFGPSVVIGVAMDSSFPGRISAVLENLMLFGPSSGVGITVNGTCIIRYVQCSQWDIGIQLNQYTNSTFIDGVTSVGNRVGLFGTGSNVTASRIAQSRFRKNTGAGLQFDGGDTINVDNCVLESNSGFGLVVNNSPANVNLNSCWFENNTLGHTAVSPAAQVALNTCRLVVAI